MNLGRDAKVSKKGNKHIGIRPSSLHVPGDGDHLVHWKREATIGQTEEDMFRVEAEKSQFWNNFGPKSKNLDKKTSLIISKH